MFLELTISGKGVSNFEIVNSPLSSAKIQTSGSSTQVFKVGLSSKYFWVQYALNENVFKTSLL